MALCDTKKLDTTCYGVDIAIVVFSKHLQNVGISVIYQK